jgi:predicted RNA-binding Zn-ribbon protein involved in translation (DUF1610 family)
MRKNEPTLRASHQACPVCGKGILVEVDNITSEMDGYVFIEKGQRCTGCGEEFVHEKDAQQTIEVAKKLGVWPQPLKLHRSLSKSGRGFVLRIPSDLEKDLRLKPGEPVSISKVGNTIVTEPED